MTNREVIELLQKGNENTKQLTDIILKVIEERMNEIEKQENCTFCKGHIQNNSNINRDWNHCPICGRILEL